MDDGAGGWTSGWVSERAFGSLRNCYPGLAIWRDRIVKAGVLRVAVRNFLG